MGGLAMVRNAKKKALYEIIVGARSKPGYEQLRPKIVQQETAEQPKTENEPTPNLLRWVRKPRLVQFNAGRIEFSVPYQIGIAAVLGAILVILLAFRLGEWFGVRAARGSPSQSRSGQAVVADKPVENPTKEITKAEQPAAAATSGRNRIVIKIYQVQAHLEPVKEYFDKLGVATEIIERNNLYYLVTKNGYDNPDRPGTNGYEAKRKIIELGAGYKAPAGYETFGPKPFSDAFGMRFEE
jgi:hypothetical protein